MKTLLIDNHDSFTFNLFQLLADVNREEPIVVRNDEAAWDDLAQRDFDNIVISPGPGRPERPTDFGVCLEALRWSEVPVLGVCLGHQGIGHIYGAEIEPAPEVMHGRLSPIFHDGKGLFEGMPQGFEAVRYHSLCVRPQLPEELERTAWTTDGVIMGLRHRELPRVGVQFHPESICTSHGRRLMENFRTLTEAFGSRRPRQSLGRSSPVPWSTSDETQQAAERTHHLLVRRLEEFYDPEASFVRLFGSESPAFWLDSSQTEDGRSRFSFMGAAGGPLSFVARYDVGSQQVAIVRGETVEHRDGTIFDYLRRELDRFSLPSSNASEELPFDFDCGFVGYFGYELKADCDGMLVHRSPLPDATLLFADRLLAFDHQERRTWLVCLTDDGTEADGEAWLDEMAEELEIVGVASAVDEDVREAGDPTIEFTLDRSHREYLDDIREIHRQLERGETYEVCLTNKVRVDAAPDPLSLYLVLRRSNPAPYSAFLRFGELSVLCSSPERFLRIQRDGWVETKPIKGTAPRGKTPSKDLMLAEELRTSEKTRAENLMITDLMRSDLGRVCEIGTVHVPHLMAIESYETVHQLVSTIRGRLREHLGPADCIQACFPAGSMTGAPKRRTMEIIDGLEHEARGIYSGSIGFVGLSGGADLNIVIRTIVMDGESTSIGTGGAIVMRSNADEEFQEIVLKAKAPLKAIALADAGSVIEDEEPDREPAQTLAGAVQQPDGALPDASGVNADRPGEPVRVSSPHGNAEV